MTQYSRQEALHRLARIYELMALIVVEDMSSERDDVELTEAAAELMRMVNEDGVNGTLPIRTTIGKGSLRVTFSGTLNIQVTP